MEYIKLQQNIEEIIDKAASNLKKSPKSRMTNTYLQARLDLLEGNWKSFESNHQTILLESKDPSNTYFTNETYDRVEEKYIDYKCQLKEALEKMKSTMSTSSTHTHNNLQSESNPSSAVKLSRIIIPVFSGKYAEWPTFHDLFESVINNNQTLAPVQKLHYLKGHLTGEAEQLIRYTPITDANYEQCWTLLKKRYSNTRYISSCILNRLISQKTLTAASSYGVKQILDTTNECLSALTNMNIDVSTWDLIIIHLIIQKLDQESRKEWEHKISDYSDKLPTFSEFSTFLESRFRALEFLEPSTKKETRLKETERPKVFSITSSASSVSCPFCAEAHLLYQCKRFSQDSVQQRRDFVKSKALCFNCFGAKHSATHCKRDTTCRRCGRRHHSLLHLDSEQPPSAQPSRAVEGVKIHNQQPSTHEKSEQKEPGPGNIVAHAAKSSRSSNSEIILTTALVKVENKGNCHILRAFLDQGAQLSFVTERAVQLLQLHKIPVNVSVDPSGLGGEKIPLSVPIKHKVQFKIQSICSSFSCVVQAYVVSQVTNPIPSQKVEIHDWQELKKLKMADPGYDTPGHVDMLLGAEVYGLTLTEGIVRNPTSTLTAQNTALGWILSGRTQVTRGTRK
ncbi:uncharacterized protein LOC133524526 isoform X2 [Cydia pomonella]|uniref:uncharacterized protein LOC133524526 isoform X2 n=1 Tax=Cydia pomonella TaxID=82600 RepID=UPI002ADD6105|nr:uncharacterized protein LOC133524526 isoform X2 [Cydia pomonella]